MHVFNAVFYSLLVLGTSAASPHDGNAGDVQLTGGNPNVERDESELPRHCSWNDGYGRISCHRFSVLFGDRAWDEPNPTVRLATPGNGPWRNLSCHNGTETLTSFHKRELSWPVDIQSGNICEEEVDSESTDDWFAHTWIEYAGLHIDVSLSGRCESVEGAEGGHTIRCVIEMA